MECEGKKQSGKKWVGVGRNGIFHAQVERNKKQWNDVGMNGIEWVKGRIIDVKVWEGVVGTQSERGTSVKEGKGVEEVVFIFKERKKRNGVGSRNEWNVSESRNLPTTLTSPKWINGPNY